MGNVQEDAIWCGACMLHSTSVERELENILRSIDHPRHLSLARVRHNLEALGETGCLDRDIVSQLSEAVRNLEETIHRWRWQDDDLSWEHYKETKEFIENKVRPKAYALKSLWQEELHRLAEGA
ncbi:MAG: hypothetical protein M0R06_17580 [Sphaerochaeta sp.]|jgi:hypothetical protein|nr:hypothetical protein [Sphaerochaeta sp.]